MAVFIVLWPYLSTTKLRSVIRHNLGHSNLVGCFRVSAFVYKNDQLPFPQQYSNTYYLFSMFTEKLIFVSYMFQASGLVMLVIGVWMMSQLHKYVDTESPIATTLPIIFLGLSAAILLLAALACCCTAIGKVPLACFIYILDSSNSSSTTF